MSEFLKNVKFTAVNIVNSGYNIIVTWEYLEGQVPDGILITSNFPSNPLNFLVIAELHIQNKSATKDSFTITTLDQKTNAPVTCVASPLSGYSIYLTKLVHNDDDTWGGIEEDRNIILLTPINFPCPPTQNPNVGNPYIVVATACAETIHNPPGLKTTFASPTSYNRFLISWGLKGEGEDGGGDFNDYGYGGTVFLSTRFQNAEYWIRIKAGDVDWLGYFHSRTNWSTPDYTVKSASNSRSVSYFFEKPINGIKELMNGISSVRIKMRL